MKLAANSSNSSSHSPRNVFQVFQTSSKYNSGMFIEWYNWISDSPYYSPQKFRKPPKISFSLVISAAICLGTWSKCSKWVPRTTPWALWNGIIRFPIVSTIVPKKAQNRRKSFFSLVISAAIPLGTCFKCSKWVPSTIRWALSYGMLRFSPAQNITFMFFLATSIDWKTIISARENLSIQSDRARRVILGTSIGTRS